ncbi:MAG: phosphatase PAP2 family protein [Oligoflexia bacterium]|nr:phosphatase PAP2 family protein [Oligoflexia bacterium]
MKKIIFSLNLFLFLCSFSTITMAADADKMSEQPSDKPSNKAAPIEFERPKMFDFITNVPSTMVSAWKMSFNTKPETLWVWGGIISSTVVLYVFDEKILNEVGRWGRDLGLGNEDKTTTVVKKNNISIFRGPTEAGSAMYFLGDGWMHTFIGTGFLLTGLSINDNRAIQTGNQIFHGMISSTIVNQIFKRSFGRESPYRKSKEKGSWRMFPSFSTYNNDTSKYDAMPTGHLMVTSMTFTVISENYPDYRSYILPIGFTWCTLLGLQMVNNRVHWISDYPLGIAMGYVFGKVSSKYGRIEKKDNKDKQKNSFIESWNVLPAYYSEGNGERTYGLFATLSFY